VLACSGFLAGCGMGGAEHDAAAKTGSSAENPAATAFTITTTSLPAGQPGVAYPTTTLATANAPGAVTWEVAEGTVPAGLSLDAAGVLSGTPEGSCFCGLTVRATSGVRTAERTFALSVGMFGVVASTGLVEGRAWTGVPVTLTCAGAIGSVRFEVVRTDSAGAYAATNPSAGTAVWMPGDVGGATHADQLRAVDTVSGAVAVLAFSVVVDPTAGFAPEFGASDVWYVDPAVKIGTHAYATDFHAVLVATGLRQASSTTVDGDACDRLAEACVRAAMLRHVNLMYARNADGTRGSGLPVSFCWREPAGYVRASPGSWLSGRSDRYSVMAIAHGTRQNVVGTAFEDGADNGMHENDSPSAGGGELGVFPNQLVTMFNLTYNNHELVDRPVTAADVDALEAILYGFGTAAGRPAAIAVAIDGLGRSIASVVAHEVGHSLGLSHTSPSEPGSIMNSMGVIAPSAVYRFTDADMARLRARLPGTGRWSTSAKVGTPTAAEAAMPAGGIRVCGEGEKCNLRLAPCGCAGCAHGHLVARTRAP
jgi:hypothetical protein